MLLTVTKWFIHWRIAPCLPTELIVGIRCLIHHSLSVLPRNCRCLGLLPLSHRERRVQAYMHRYATRGPSILHRLLLFGLLTHHAFAAGLTVKWGSQAQATSLPPQPSGH